jgi:alanine racemase
MRGMNVSADISGVPRCTLDGETIRANARVWRELCGGRLRAVVKSDGYGWGVGRLIRLLEGEVEDFCVLDPSEARDLYDTTTHPITLLGACDPPGIAEALARGARPNIATLAELDAVLDHVRARGGAVTIRVGLAPALSWHGLAPEAVPAFTQRLASEPHIAVELWTHLTSVEAEAEELRAFEAFVTQFEAAKARIVGTDIAASASAARGIADATRPLRIGIGLFGAYRHQLPRLRCALRLEARVVSRCEASPSLRAGYGRHPLPAGDFVETLRLGYGDGFPRGLLGATLTLEGGEVRIASIGMQQTVITHDLPPAASRTLLHPLTDLAELCAPTAITPHELVLGLGAHSQCC